MLLSETVSLPWRLRVQQDMHVLHTNNWKEIKLTCKASDRNSDESVLAPPTLQTVVQPGQDRQRMVEGFFSTLSSLFDSCRFGRKPVLFGSMALMSIAILLQVFSTSWTMFTVLFFISGVGRVSSYISAFVLGNCEDTTLFVIDSCFIASCRALFVLCHCLHFKVLRY